ncbi:hypothetical protein [Virgisporangium aurantiacum]|uniref:hypothetical protein n=1 Tax=Virgisporangium aurantiacum TaxID=175570 RepID=UPI00195143C7|nr:hypothetical protein [Virgisporangium aurantiacum]
MSNEPSGGQGNDVGTGPERTPIAVDVAEAVWRPFFVDPILSRPPTPVGPGNVPAGGDLDLGIGWDRFEQLMVFVARGLLGLNRVKFRRYGLPGQAQHGIDLAGRHADGSYTVVQCKEYDEFKAADLREAVSKFAVGDRPFGSRRLIVAVSVVTRDTRVEEELGRLQDQYPDLEIELWGAEQINDVLRERADIVARFWTRETAETFCTGAPLPGVSAPPPDWARVADQVLLTPLGVDGMDEDLARADELRTDQPLAAAPIYADLADRLDADGYTGHANLMRRRQLDALAAAGEEAAWAALTAQLAATALHEGDWFRARSLRMNLDPRAPRPVRVPPPEPGDADSGAAGDPQTRAITAWHLQLIAAAVTAATHQLADSSALITALRQPLPAGVEVPTYQPLLVLLAAELTYADAVITPQDQPTAGGSAPVANPVVPAVSALDDLISAALRQLASAPPSPDTRDVAVRLQLVRATYDPQARAELVAQARQRRLPRHHAALVLAAQARREAIDGFAEEAVEHFRQAVEHGLHDGRTDHAAGWLYAIRAVGISYGPLTDRMDEEHMLAQALPKTGGRRLIRRVRDPQTDARREALDGDAIDAIRAARRWLADCIVTGDWADEDVAAELLGDLYAANLEPDRAACCYQWGNALTKAIKLAKDVGDHVLPRAATGSGPWWQRAASLAIAAEQQDLIDDATAAALLRELFDLVVRGRAGELVEGPGQPLTRRTTATMLIFAGRGSSEDARRVLDLLANDVTRAADHYFPHDEQHVQACLAIAAHHAELAWAAFVRLFDLAEAGAPKALEALRQPAVRAVLEESAPAADGAPLGALTEQQRRTLRDRLHAMAAAGRYEAGLAAAMLGDTDPAVTQRALAARKRLLSRPEPDGHGHAFGTAMVSDSYLVGFLAPDQQRACLDKVLAVASDRREAAVNRQDALTAAANLVRTQPDSVKADVHARSRPFVTGDQDGSALDDETTNPHPLSSFKINFGSPSLQAEGLRLALGSAVSAEEIAWVRETAMVLIGSGNQRLARESAQVLSRMGVDVVQDLDVTFLVGHPDRVVREFAAFVAATAPSRYAKILRVLAADADWTVRLQLAMRLNAFVKSSGGIAGDPEPARLDQSALTIAQDVLTALSRDVRHRIRRAAADQSR